LHHSHRNLGIAHRDIKLGNILLNDSFKVPILKLCDFGYSKKNLMGSLPRTRVGTAAYISPEVARADVSTVKYDTEKADIWSSAVTLYCMLAGRYPFTNKGKVPELYHIKKLTDADAIEALKVLHDTSPGCIELLSLMLRTNPAERLSLDEIMQHQWYKQYLPDISKIMVCTPEYLQSEEDVLRVLAQAKKQSKQIVSGENRDEFDDERIKNVADEILENLEDFDLRGGSTIADSALTLEAPKK